MKDGEFLWGASVSAHQVEGHNTHSDWYRWERRNKERLAEKAEKRFGDLENWNSIKSRAEDPGNYVSDDADNHWDRFTEDISLAEDLGFNALRISISWSKVMPERGEFDEQALDHYKQVIRELRQRDIEPVVTLWHFTSPKWFQDEIGWHGSEAVKVFREYVEKVSSYLGDDVDYWITFNEVTGWISHAYILGSWPPAKKNPVKAWRAYQNMIRAHTEVYDVLDGETGIVVNTTDFRPYNNSSLNSVVSNFAAWIERNHLLENLEESLDWIGINHYMVRDIDFLGREKEYVITDMGWKQEPESLYRVLEKIGERFDLPLMVTENGLPDRTDELRQRFLPEYIDSVLEAREEGVDVRGYLHWSLLDNFEWDKGYWPEFGLVSVEEDNSRELKESARIYSQKIEDADL